ncbi:MAG: branched-chain amino acid ABC transporter permease [Terrimicrobiaceae bacterium]|nr:branched-chain amino acid ABC transporter permease [Terrimicrobiaceae bacterium]
MKPFLAAAAIARWPLPVLIAAGFAFTVAAQYLPILNGYTQFVLITVGINIILCASLNLVNGYMGEFSVGHAGFMSLGAYSAAIFTTKWLPATPAAFLPAVLFGGAVAAVIGFFLALLSFKTRGDYLAIITLAFLMIVKSTWENLPYVGGPRGITTAPLTTLPWVFAAVVATIWIIRNLVYSKFGRAVIAIREDEIAANAMGVRVREAKILAFVVSSFFGGVAGALSAHATFFINPGQFDILKSTEILVMVYLGGIGSLAGSILGATIFTFLSQALQPLGYWRLVILPLILVLLMLFRPRGIMGLRELPWFLPRRELLIKRELYKKP